MKDDYRNYVLRIVLVRTGKSVVGTMADGSTRLNYQDMF